MLREQTESAVDKNIPSGECEVAKINLGSEEVETTVMPPCKVPLLYPEGFPVFHRLIQTIRRDGKMDRFGHPKSSPALRYRF